MFKKLKDKIAEEVKSSPSRIQQLAQAAQVIAINFFAKITSRIYMLTFFVILFFALPFLNFMMALRYNRSYSSYIKQFIPFSA